MTILRQIYQIIDQPAMHHVVSCIRNISKCRNACFSARSFSSSLPKYSFYEPENLPPPGPPDFAPINVRIRGYDFTVVEHYMYYVTRLAHNVGAQSTKRWITPCTTSRITTFKPQSSALQNEYNLSLYERNVQVHGMTMPSLSLLLDLMNSTLPVGVTVTAKIFEPADQEAREVPDYELVALKAQLTDVGQMRKKN